LFRSIDDKPVLREDLALSVLASVIGHNRHVGQLLLGAIAVYIMSTASGYHSAETFLIDGGYYVF